MPHRAIASRVARHYDVPIQLASFLSLLIINECVTSRRIYDELGTTECRQLAYRLRKAVPTLTLHARRTVGYWLDPDARKELADLFAIVLPAKGVKVVLIKE